MGSGSAARESPDIVSNVSTQAARLYHLGIRPIARSTLARVNEQPPHELYKALFHKLLTRCQGQAPRHGFRFKNKLYSLDVAQLIYACWCFRGRSSGGPRGR